MAAVKMHNNTPQIAELADRIDEYGYPRAQFVKPIDVDGVEYTPGVDVKDWSEEFRDYGGEG